MFHSRKFSKNTQTNLLMKFQHNLAIFFQIVVFIPLIYSYDAFRIHNDFNLPGYYSQPANIVNISTLIGKTVFFNCSLSNDQELNSIKYSFKSKMNPTWLKADPIYNKYGCPTSYNTENIIVTRKGIIAGKNRQKMKLVSSYNNQFQSLQISDINVKDEGKYICREFNSHNDKQFYLNVFGKLKNTVF